MKNIFEVVGKICQKTTFEGTAKVNLWNVVILASANH